MGEINGLAYSSHWTTLSPTIAILVLTTSGSLDRHYVAQIEKAQCQKKEKG